MKRRWSILLVFLFGFGANAQFMELPIQRANECQVFISTHSYEEDRLLVELIPALIERDTAYYIMPRVVPGTYDISDFGRFVSAFVATDSRGDTLPVQRMDTNKWRIARASELYRIQYRIDDSFDAADGPDDRIFRPGGTGFGSDAFLFNLFGMVGYIQSAKNVPYTLDVEKPASMWGSTALERIASSDTLDRFLARSYFELHDRPILYAQPDTVSTMVGSTRVTVAVHSAGGTLTASDALASSAPVLEAIGSYLGGTLPTDRYVILIYADLPDPSVMGYGALEHQTSTVLYLPEFDPELMGQEIRNIVAHEFLHIVTPLAIHAQQINDFDFYSPSMSKHLWLYEGVTEYTSVLVQVRQGLMSFEEFISELESKLRSADNYDPYLPMTVMSEHVLDLFNEEYNSVYDKGAMIAMCLDLQLRVESQGQHGLLDMMNDLGQHFGPDTFFVDDALFGYLSERWGSGLDEFFARYVEGAAPLPLQGLLAQAGILYEEARAVEQVGFGELGISYDSEQERLFLYDDEGLSPMAEEMGLMSGDRLLELQGAELTIESARDIFSSFYADTRPGDKVELVVLREKKGKWKKKKLKGKASSYPVTYRHIMGADDAPDAKQIELKRSWINQ